MDTWLEVYSGGEYSSILDKAAESDAMNTFVNAFTIDLMVYACATFLHSVLIVVVGIATSFIIF